MKRVYLILTLFMASFFFVSLNEVKADTIDLIIPEEEIAIVESDFFEILRELAIEESNSRNQPYVIISNSSTISIDNLRVLFLNGSNFDMYYNGNYRSLRNANFGNAYKYDPDTSSLIWSNRHSYVYIDLYQTINSVYSYSYYKYFDTNIELIPYVSDTSDTIDIIHYKDFVYTVNPGDHYPSLYQLKQLQGSSSGDEDIERNDSLDSFYTLIIEKIQLFANNFISNNAFLFIIGIITLIFVFELIRRWLL